MENEIVDRLYAIEDKLELIKNVLIESRHNECLVCTLSHLPKDQYENILKIIGFMVPIKKD